MSPIMMKTRPEARHVSAHQLHEEAEACGLSPTPALRAVTLPDGRAAVAMERADDRHEAWPVPDSYVPPLKRLTNARDVASATTAAPPVPEAAPDNDEPRDDSTDEREAREVLAFEEQLRAEREVLRAERKQLKAFMLSTLDAVKSMVERQTVAIEKQAAALHAIASVYAEGKVPPSPVAPNDA